MDAPFDALAWCRSLIGGMDVEQFNDTIRERRWARFERAFSAEAVDALFNPTRFELLLGQDAIPIACVDIFDGDHLRRLTDLHTKSGKSCLAVIADNFRAGSTIRVRDVDRLDARLSRCVAALTRLLQAQCQVNLYLTPQARTGFPPHFDITDVLVVQCSGSKQWSLHPDYTGSVELPLPDVAWDPDRFRPVGEPQVVTLAAGDVLYLPRGVMHSASCTTRLSMHLTFSVAPLTWADLIGEAMRHAARNDIALRRRVAFPRDASADPSLAGELRTAMTRLANQVDLKALIEAERQKFEGDAEPQRESAPGFLLGGGAVD